MKKPASRRSRSSLAREMRAEYSFKGGIRGKHAARYAKGTNIVVIEPDVAEVFTDSASVNEALRALLPLILRRRKRTAGGKRGA
jgi:hypothetical protein